MMRTKVANSCATTVLAALLTVPSASFAQTSPPGSAPDQQAGPPESGQGGGLTDIVVTARRTSEPLQRTPVAVSAFNAESLVTQNVMQADKIAQVTPSLTITRNPNNPASAQFTIRGLGQGDPGVSFDMRVGIYMDGVYMARTGGALFDLVDAERIEVLRGPQGTLFGRNTIGGAIQIVSQKPSDDFGLSVRGGYTSRDDAFGKIRVDTGRIANLPLTASLTYFHREKDGIFDNLLAPDSKDPGSVNSDAVLAALKLDLDPVVLEYRYDWNEQIGSPQFFQTVATSDQYRTYFGRSVGLGGAPLQIAPVDTQIRSGLQAPGLDGRFTSSSKNQGHSINATWTINPDISLKSITAWRSVDTNNTFGLSGQGDLKGLVFDPTSPTFTSVQSVTPIEGNSFSTQDQFSQELQLLGSIGEVNFVGGLYYFNERVFLDQAQKLTIVMPGATFGMPIDLIGFTALPTEGFRQKSTSKAAFGQVSWRPTSLDERFELTGGIRYTKDKKTMTLLNEAAGVPRPDNGTDSVSFDNVSYLISASYQIDPRTLIYMRYSTGYQSGGFNAGAAGQLDADGSFLGISSYNPEKIRSVELGLKTDLLDRKLRFNLAVFLSDYKDLQISQFVPGTGGTTSILTNAGSATIKGIEAEMTALPFDHVTIRGSLGYLDASYKEFLFRNPATDVVSDISSTARFPQTPKINASIAAEYQREIDGFATLNARLQYAYRSKVYFHIVDEVSTYNTLIASPPQNNLSARIAFSDIALGGRARAEVALLGENLLNERQTGNGIDFGPLGFAGVFFNERRTIGLQLRLDY